jgi:hypothetical protein
MPTPEEPPDPTIRVAVVTSLSLQEAALLVGMLEADGIRALTAPSQRAPGAWVASPFQPGTTDVLVDERDIDEARRIADRYLKT